MKQRDVFTPEDYARVFEEGAEAHRNYGLDANSPYLAIGEDHSHWQTIQAGAWEQGWWSEYRKINEQK